MSKVFCTPEDRYVEATELGGGMAIRILRKFASREYEHGNAEFPIQALEAEIAELLEWVKQGGEDQAREAMRELCRYAGPYLWIGVDTYGRHLREPEKTNVIPFRARR